MDLHLYILGSNGIPAPEPDALRWAAWFENPDHRRIADTALFGNVRVSTVFLGMDHNFFFEGPPVLFETMIFGGPLDREIWRYATIEQATLGHERACGGATRAWKIPDNHERFLRTFMEECYK